MGGNIQSPEGNFDWNFQPSSLSPIPKRFPGLISAEIAAKLDLNNFALIELRDSLGEFYKDYPGSARILEFISTLNGFGGIKNVCVGIYPGDSSNVDRITREVLVGMRDQYPEIIPSLLCLATPESVNWAIEMAQIHPKVKILVFRGTSPDRLFVENRTLSDVLKSLDQSVSRVRREGILVKGAAEHATQTAPENLKAVIRTLINAGATEIVVPDTAGVAIGPTGPYRIIKYVIKILTEMGVRDQILVSWHGHNDLGLATSNAMWAILAGAGQVDVTPWGAGERAGNVSFEQVLVLMRKMLFANGIREVPWDLSRLMNVLDNYSDMTGINTDRGPLGTNSNTTAYGIHAAAYFKFLHAYNLALQSGDTEMAELFRSRMDTVYSGMPHRELGNEPIVFKVSPLSGAANVKGLGIQRGVEYLPDKFVECVLSKARQLNRELREEEINQLFDEELPKYLEV